MVIYFVHAPPNASANRLESAEELLFVKDGFSWFAMALPAIWLLMRRMWLEAIAFTAGSALIMWAFTAAGAPNAGSAILLIVQIIFGFEAGAFYSDTLDRRGWRLVGTVSGRNAEDSERRFLEAWLPTHTEIPAPNHPSAPPKPSWTRTAIDQARNLISGSGRSPEGAQP